MSTQYSVVNTRITEEVAEFQKKVSAIRAEWLRMMREASVPSRMLMGISSFSPALAETEPLRRIMASVSI